jgi:hypothetical protein
MAIQTTPHTQTRQNLSAAAPDLDPNQLPQELGQGDDAELYANTAGAPNNNQIGGTRAFHANDTRSNLPKVLQEDAALTGTVNTRTPESDQQGITNHSASEESARQRKVVSERPDAQAGVDQVGHRVR